MKTKLLLLAFISCILFTSCEKDSTEINQDSFETTFQKKGLSDPFAFNYTIVTTEGETANLTTEQVKDFLSGKLLNSDEITDYTDFQLFQNPDNELQYALTAVSTDGFTKISAQMLQMEFGFELTGVKCECKSTCGIGCSPSSWGGDCRCSDCSNRGVCNKTASIEIPDNSIIAAP